MDEALWTALTNNEAVSAIVGASVYWSEYPQGVAVPAICTPVGMNRDVVKDGLNGFYANSPEDWIEKISVLIKDAPLRKEMGARGRDIVMKGYTIEACAPRFTDIIRNVAGSELQKPGTIMGT